MKKYLLSILSISIAVFATDTVTITSRESQDGDQKWVLVEVDCENPEIKCD